MASGNSAAVSRKNSRAASVSAPWRSERRSSRARTARKAVTGYTQDCPPPLAGGGWGEGAAPPSRPPPPNPLPQGEGEASGMTLMPAPVPRLSRTGSGRWVAAITMPPPRAVRRQHGAEPLHRHRIQPQRRLVQQPKRGLPTARAWPAPAGAAVPPTACAPGRSASSANPTAAKASRTLPPVSRAANRRFSAAVSPGFTASWCPT